MHIAAPMSNFVVTFVFFVNATVVVNKGVCIMIPTRIIETNLIKTHLKTLTQILGLLSPITSHMNIL
jgi:hypothetical protein